MFSWNDSTNDQKIGKIAKRPMRKTEGPARLHPARCSERMNRCHHEGRAGFSVAANVASPARRLVRESAHSERTLGQFRARFSPERAPGHDNGVSAEAEGSRMDAGIDPALRDLPLREFRPRSSLRVEGHDVARSRFPVIDIHNHLGRWLSEGGRWTSRGRRRPHRADGLVQPDLESVNLDGRWGDELEANLDRYDRGHPGRFATFCHLDWSVTSEPDFTDRLVGSLRRSAATGARGVKVWKDLGLRIRDRRGCAADARRRPPLGRVGRRPESSGSRSSSTSADPVAFFDPVDGNNERLEELLEHPDWSFSDPRFPRFERIDGVA